ncbi:GNAT family N-acetyltransferase [Gelidibacter salicanalis]|uniref:GNAT family N-acetyltransferase n=1 Tax=Gelidibacter salicanalis TaxID=291193 RepID=A0A5C7AH92_9FLAO|nr:GNAT family N-acetyltransferase [Gelidibacter salicanalis]TXE07364.1 GNAT family N-acetyltransferase [Gelidibacter salicanalis]
MIRNYSTEDKSKIIALLIQNTPEYFDPAEEQDLSDYLDTKVEDYFVYEEHSKILGAGGINYILGDHEARISWDMVAPETQGKGIGKALLHHRIKHINRQPNIQLISVRTSQLAYKFYEKFGFELVYVEKEYWAKNFDLYQLEMIN